MGPRAGRKEEGRSVVVIVIVIVELATATATTARWNGCVRESGCRARWCHVTSRQVAGGGSEVMYGHLAEGPRCDMFRGWTLVTPPPTTSHSWMIFL